MQSLPSSQNRVPSCSRVAYKSITSNYTIVQMYPRVVVQLCMHFARAAPHSKSTWVGEDRDPVSFLIQQSSHPHLFIASHSYIMAYTKTTAKKSHGDSILKKSKKQKMGTPEKRTRTATADKAATLRRHTRSKPPAALVKSHRSQQRRAREARRAVRGQGISRGYGLHHQMLTRALSSLHHQTRQMMYLLRGPQAQ